VLEQNEMPFVGGIPINFDEMRSPISFQFSGGIPGAFTAFAYDAATRLKAKKVAVAYGDFAAIKAAGVDYGIGTLHKLGVTDVTDIPFPVTTTDFLPVLTKANEGHPDAIILGAADSACAPAMKTAQELKITATLYLVGACAAPTIAQQVGEAAVDGKIFNIEGPKGDDDPETKLYFDVVAKYGDPQLPAASAATISFRNIFNLYEAMVDLGAAKVTRPAILEYFRSARNHPSFTGHPYTCDGQQIPDLPAMCAPQQLLVERKDKSLVVITDWIDVPALVNQKQSGDAAVTTICSTLLGTGSGVVIAALALGIVLTYRASGVVNFAHAAMGMFLAYTYGSLRQSGELLVPILGPWSRIKLLPSSCTAEAANATCSYRFSSGTAFVITMALAALYGFVIYVLAFRPLRNAPALAKLVASLGLFLYLLAITNLRIGSQGAALSLPENLLPSTLIHILGVDIQQDRLWLALVVILMTAVLAAVYHYTRFGLANAPRAKAPCWRHLTRSRRAQLDDRHDVGGRRGDPLRPHHLHQPDHHQPAVRPRPRRRPPRPLPLLHHHDRGGVGHRHAPERDRQPERNLLVAPEGEPARGAAVPDHHRDDGDPRRVAAHPRHARPRSLPPLTETAAPARLDAGPERARDRGPAHARQSMARGHHRVDDLRGHRPVDRRAHRLRRPDLAHADGAGRHQRSRW
jgi:hypothetical protein